MSKKIKVLDHGFVRLVESWGGGDYAQNPTLPDAGYTDCEAGIIEAARQSTQGGFKGWKNDARLLKYLYDNKHSTPFEFAGMVIEVKAPIFIFRQWQRHRTQCLSGDTEVYFDQPSAVAKGKRRIYKLTMKELWDRWKPTIRSTRPERQTNAFYKRTQVMQMNLRNVDEATGEVLHGNIVSVIKGDPKLMYEVTVSDGRKVVSSFDHKYFTNRGWMTLSQIHSNQDDIQLMMQTTERRKPDRVNFDYNITEEVWKGVAGSLVYEVSSHGRVKSSKGIKKPTVANNKHDVVSLKMGGEWSTHNVHILVCTAFHGPRPSPEHECCHIDSNKANNQASNLRWGTSKENSQDQVKADRQQRLVTQPFKIQSIKAVGMQDSYDLSVEGYGHNFIANGFVVHNSYNEMSARYGEVPNENYMPTVDRLMMDGGKNKQAGSTKDSEELTRGRATTFLSNLGDQYEEFEIAYNEALSQGVPKELARLGMPVGRYSQMRASASLRNWLAFLTLRLDPHAQWEIQQFAKAVASLIEQEFPQTYKLFVGANPQ